ncbi:hypothetical protein AB7W88_13270 [Providencia vermicola]
MTKKSSHFHCDTGLVSVVAKAEVAVDYPQTITLKSSTLTDNWH